MDYKKAYDMVPQSWIINCLKMYKISDKLYRENHENLESGIDSRREKLSSKEVYFKEIHYHHYYL